MLLKPRWLTETRLTELVREYVNWIYLDHSELHTKVTIGKKIAFQ
jgi:hypothetical protein